MALRLNLLNEIETARRARQRDPLKLGIYAVIAVALCFLGYYFYKLASTSAVLSERNRMQSEWASLEPQQRNAAEKATQLQANIAVSKNIVGQIENRFYWAPLLERIGEIVPPVVQINRLSGEWRGPRECTLSIQGTAAGVEPRNVAEKLRIAFQNKLTDGGKVTSTFVSLENGATAATINGRSLPTAVFNISLSVTLPEETPAAP